MAIVYPKSAEEVSELLKFCNENLINVIPRGGKTATEGGLENWKDLTIVIDALYMDKILKIDPYNSQATVQAGVALQDLEDELRKIGYTTGHSPQSKPVAKYGGLLATRSIGQFSTLYGGIEDMVVGLECVFPDGHISRIKMYPDAQADRTYDISRLVMRELFAISLKLLSNIKFYPENNKFYGYLINMLKRELKFFEKSWLMVSDHPLQEHILKKMRLSISIIFTI